MRSLGELERELLPGFSKPWIWFDSGKTSESELISCRATSNQIAISFGTTEAQLVDCEPETKAFYELLWLSPFSYQLNSFISNTSSGGFFLSSWEKGLENSNLDWVGTKTIENETATERYKDGK